MNSSELLKKSINGGAIIGISLIIRSLIGLIVQISLARMIAPEIFGTIAYAATIGTLLSNFANFRGDIYVITNNKKNTRSIDAVFTLEMLSSTVFALLLLVFAPMVMVALGKGEVTLYVQIFAITYFYNPLSRLRCLLEQDLLFLQSKIPFVIAHMVGAVSTIVIAYLGFGIWALLWWRVSVLAGEVIILWIFAQYRPKFYWDPVLMSSIWKFSWPLVASGILAFLSYNIDYFIIGQYLENGAKQLGYYWLGFQAASYLLMFRQILNNVLLPIFSKTDDESLKKRAFVRLSKTTSAFFVLLVIGVIFFGKDLIIVLYGIKWEAAVLPFQIIIVVVMMRAINSNGGYLLYSSGKTKPEFYSAALYVCILAPLAFLATINYGINGTAISVLVAQICVTILLYEGYIKPIAGYGVVYFFGWPLIISALSFLLLAIQMRYELSVVIKVLFFVMVLLMAYVTMIKSVVYDIIHIRKKWM